MNANELTEQILALCGEKENIISAQNCMTRLRLTLVDPDKVDVQALMELEGVLGVVQDVPLQIILGPGKAQKIGFLARDQLREGYVKPIPLSIDKTWEDNKAAHKTHFRQSTLKNTLAQISGIFTPMIPAIVAAGLCKGLGAMLSRIPGADAGLLFSCSQMLILIGTVFFSCFSVMTGFYAAKTYGGTPVLGAVLGAMPLSTAACGLPGAGGGVLGVILGAFLLSKVEKWLKERISDTFSLLLVPVLSVVITGVIHVFFIMPAAGWVSTLLLKGLRFLTDSPYLMLRILVGFVLSAVFLPMVMGGYHHALVLLYAIELQQLGNISLLPCLIMAGAGQVGACLAIYLKAKKCGNEKLVKTIGGAMGQALLGIGEPLIYGVTLPMGKPFMTAGLGAGFGGALCLALQVKMIAWGTSGLAAIPLMQNFSMMLSFLGALVLTYIMGFGITSVLIPGKDVKNA